jgi:hypothetical protein
MCITGGGAQPPDQRAKNTKSRRDEIIKQPVVQNNLALAGLWVGVVLSPAVALRSTAGYAHHTPAGLKNWVLSAFGRGVRNMSY